MIGTFLRSERTKRFFTATAQGQRGPVLAYSLIFKTARRRLQEGGILSS